MPFQVDSQGIITEGRFQGHHIENVASYAESLEETIKSGASPSSPAPSAPAAPAPRPSPEQALQQQAGQRVSAVESLTAQRLEQDDEAEFARMVPDYETPIPNTNPPITIRQAVWHLKASLPMGQRIQKGIHATLYGMVKQQTDQKARAAIYGTPPPVEKPAEEDEDDAETEATSETPAPAPRAATPPASSPAVRPVPKAVSPVASPTPTRRDSGSKVKKPTLQASDKVAKMARTMGKPLDAYLLELEASGYTQSDIDRMAEARPAQSARRRTVYDAV
jgi:hypothetical protein